MQNYSDSSADLNQNRRRWISFIVIAFVIALMLITTAVILATRGGHSHHYPQADQEQSTVFQGMSSFINDGLTTDQVNYLIQGLSKFSPKAKTIAIDSSSLTPAPHNPGQPFTIKFRLTIDSKPYKGVASYSDLTSIRLSVYTNSGNKVFDSEMGPTGE